MFIQTAFIQRVIKRFSVITLTLILTPFVVLLSFGIYLITVFSVGTVIRPMGIFGSLFIPAVLVPIVCAGMLKVTRSLYQAQDELLHAQEELKGKVVDLERSEERYRSIFENSPIGIFQSTFEGRFLRVNPALAGILRYESPEELVDSVSDIGAEIYADPEARAGILRRIQENGGRITCEYEYFRKDGSRGIGHLTLRMINDENGAPHHLDGTVEDVTEKRMMEKRLQQTMGQLRTLSHRLLEVQEMERRYIARELHDEIGQTLTALRIDLKRTGRPEAPEAAALKPGESADLVEDLINKVRNLSVELRPSIIDDFGLTEALSWYVNRLNAKAGFKVVFYSDFTEERFPPVLELTCFRITQEALTNAARHSNAAFVYVDLERMGGELHLTVRDDGKGFDIDETRMRALKGESFGLLGMQERASLAGGYLKLTSEPGKGTVIHACFPLEQTEEEPVGAIADNS